MAGLRRVEGGGLKHLDVAQLVKHYLGLIRLADRADEGRKRKEVTLLYLFWEPTNAHDIGDCLSHRRNIEEMASKVSGSRIKFRSLSYPELWREWESLPGISSHLANLKARYSLAVKFA